MGNTSAKQRARQIEAKENLFTRADQVLAMRAEAASASAGVLPLTTQAFRAALAEQCQAQLLKRGAPLTKDDLIMILFKLQGMERNELAFRRYNDMSCTDLRAALRLLLYAADVVEVAVEEARDTATSDNAAHQIKEM